MNTLLRCLPEWPVVLRRYLMASAGLHLGWEVVQLPFYTIWSEPFARQVFAILHCTIGDLMIAGLSLMASLALVGRPEWPRSGLRSVWLLLVIMGVGYTIYSEWLNVSVRQSWAYSPMMPTFPVLGTGVTPLLQWIVVPTLAIRFASGQWPMAHSN